MRGASWQRFLHLKPIKENQPCRMLVESAFLMAAVLAGR